MLFPLCRESLNCASLQPTLTTYCRGSASHGIPPAGACGRFEVASASLSTSPQNFPLLQLPPQLQTEQNPDITCTLPNPPAWCASGTGFLAGGGLRQTNVPPATREEAQAATQGIILDQVQPKVLTWTLGVQRELMKNTSLELVFGELPHLDDETDD
jgi:hypothetical protein